MPSSSIPRASGRAWPRSSASRPPRRHRPRPARPPASRSTSRSTRRAASSRPGPASRRRTSRRACGRASSGSGRDATRARARLSPAARHGARADARRAYRAGHRCLDARRPARATEVARNDVADCVLKLERAVAFDLHAERPDTGRFVIVDDYEIRGGGIVREALADGEEAARDTVLLRNRKWEHSLIAPDLRAARFGQRPAVVIVTGPAGARPQGAGEGSRGAALRRRPGRVFPGHGQHALRRGR